MSIARQLTKKFEPYKTNKTDSNMLLFHTLKKMIDQKAIYERYMKQLADDERIEVSIPIESFEHEARDFQHHNISEFFKSSHFNKDFKMEGRLIKTLHKV